MANRKSVNGILFETDEGLRLESDGIRLLQHGAVKDGVLRFVYRVKFGAITFRYRDLFWIGEDGVVENHGTASLFGVDLLKIKAIGSDQESEIPSLVSGGFYPQLCSST